MRKSKQAKTNFKPYEFGGFRNEAGRNSFYMSPKKWVEATGVAWLRENAEVYRKQ